MAKKLENVATISFIAVSQLVSDPSQNWGRIHTAVSSESNLKELRSSLKQHHWRHNDHVEARPLTPEEREMYHAKLVAELATLEAAAALPTAGDREKTFLKIWKLMRCTKGGTVKKPDYLVVTGNQRFSQIFEASTDRYMDGLKTGWGTHGVDAPNDPETGEPNLAAKPADHPELWTIDPVPMAVTTFASLADQIETQLLENTMKLTGNQEPDRLDVALAARKLIELRKGQFPGELPTEAVLSRWCALTKRGMQQDVWQLVAIDHYGGEELNYLERCSIKDTNDPMYINYGWRMSDNWGVGTKKGTTRRIKRMDPAWVDAERAKMEQNGKDKTHPEWPEYGTKAEFVTYFNWTPPADFEPKKRMDFAKMGEYATEYGADVLKDFLNGAKNGDLDEFEAKYASMGPAFNLVAKLAGLIGIEMVETILAKITTSADPSRAAEEVIALLESMPVAGVPVTGTVIEAEPRRLTVEAPKIENLDVPVARG